MKRSSARAPERTNPANTFILDFWAPERRENKFLLFASHQAYSNLFLTLGANTCAQKHMEKNIWALFIPAANQKQNECSPKVKQLNFGVVKNSLQ